MLCTVRESARRYIVSQMYGKAARPCGQLTAHCSVADDADCDDHAWKRSPSDRNNARPGYMDICGFTNTHRIWLEFEPWRFCNVFVEVNNPLGKRLVFWRLRRLDFAHFITKICDLGILTLFSFFISCIGRTVELELFTQLSQPAKKCACTLERLKRKDCYSATDGPLCYYRS